MTARPEATSADRAASRLTDFYGEMSSIDSIMRGLVREGVDAKKFTARDLYSRGLDVQTLGGLLVLETVIKGMEEYGAPNRGDAILDVGCGLGGPSRYLADRYGCRVTGVDLLPIRVEVASSLARMVGMDKQVTYRVADATQLPFKKGQFAQVWMLDASIHIRDKGRLFAELARVLAPAGLLVMHDQPGPLPPSMRPVMRRAPYIAPTLPQLIRHLQSVGLEVLTWRATTPLAVQDLKNKMEARQKAQATGSVSPARLKHSLAAGLGYIKALEKEGSQSGFFIARRVT
ncbi:MAG: methyltransferase domain-containing protein [Chloroflexi bacterium]|nr:methyltransferase domain-containing protein [Chloroflexota bacterium]